MTARAMDIKTILTLATFVMLAVWSQHSHASNGNKFAEIVNPKSLGITIEYAENVIDSPPMKISTNLAGTQINLYRMGECTVALGIKNGEVISVSGQLSHDTCDINVKPIIGGPNRKASNTRIQDYAARGKLHFTAIQIPTCMSCGEGIFYALIDAVSATGNYEVQLTARTNAGYRMWWSLLLRVGLVSSSLPITGYNCPLREFDPQALLLMKGQQVSSIAFGKPGSLQPRCRGN